MNPDMAAKYRAVGDRYLVANAAIVGHMASGHQESAVANRGHALLFLAGTINRDPLADRVVVADLDPGRSAAVTDVLRLTADHTVWINSVAGPNHDTPHERDVVFEHSSGANHSLSRNHAGWPHANIGSEFRTRINHRRWMDLGWSTGQIDGTQGVERKSGVHRRIRPKPASREGFAAWPPACH